MNHAPVLNVGRRFSLLVQSLVDNTSSVIYIKGTDFRYQLINRQFETLFHVSRDEILDKDDFDIFPRELADTFRKNDRQVLETGEAVQCEEVAPQDDGLHTYFSHKFPLRDPNGVIYAIAGISTDITDQLRHQQVIDSLLHRHNLILESVGDGICGLDANGRIAFLNPAAEKMLKWSNAELQGRNHTDIVLNRKPIDWMPSATACKNGSGNVPGQNGKSDGESAVSSASAEVRASIFRCRDGSSLPVEYTASAIIDNHDVVGAVVAFRDTTDRLKQIAVDQEIQTARRIQLSLNPKTVPSIEGFDFAAMSLPCARACGDYYDFIDWGQNRLGIVVGDVSGHGLVAALEMIATRSVLRTTMLSEWDPVLCLNQLNKILTADLPDELFVTLFLASLDLKARKLTYAAAGHDAILLRASGELLRLGSTGTVLGWNASEQYSNGGTYLLQPGDVFLLATDGFAESVSPSRELFGRERLIQVLRRYQSYSASEILGFLNLETEKFRKGVAPKDDMTGIVMKVW